MHTTKGWFKNYRPRWPSLMWEQSQETLHLDGVMRSRPISGPSNLRASWLSLLLVVLVLICSERDETAPISCSLSWSGASVILLRHGEGCTVSVKRTR